MPKKPVEQALYVSAGRLNLVCVPLHTCPERITLVASWLLQAWPGWYGPQGQGDPLADAQAYAASAASLPCGVLALRDGEPVGFAAIKTEPLPACPGWGPWAGAGYVIPALRGQGLGAQLLAGLLAHARTLGLPALYCATATADTLLRRSGWHAIAQVAHGEQRLNVYQSPSGCRT